MLEKSEGIANLNFEMKNISDKNSASSSTESKVPGCLRGEDFKDCGLNSQNMAITLMPSASWPCAST